MLCHAGSGQVYFHGFKATGHAGVSAERFPVGQQSARVSDTALGNGAEPGYSKAISYGTVQAFWQEEGSSAVGSASGKNCRTDCGKDIGGAEENSGEAECPGPKNGQGKYAGLVGSSTDRLCLLYGLHYGQRNNLTVQFLTINQFYLWKQKQGTGGRSS